MRRALTTLAAITVALAVASTAAAENPNPHETTDAAVATTGAATGGTTSDATPVAMDTGDRSARRAAVRAFETTIPHGGAPTAGLRMPGMAGVTEQNATADRDEWQRSLDAARSKRKRAMYLTLGGFIGGPLVGGTIGTAAVKAGQDTGGIAASTMVGMAGVGVGVWGVYQWITAQGDIGRLEQEGNRAGYVSVMPVRGGAAATLSLSF